MTTPLRRVVLTQTNTYEAMYWVKGFCIVIKSNYYSPFILSNDFYKKESCKAKFLILENPHRVRYLVEFIRTKATKVILG